jgi:hypothetical protein
VTDAVKVQHIAIISAAAATASSGTSESNGKDDEIFDSEITDPEDTSSSVGAHLLQFHPTPIGNRFRQVARPPDAVADS